MVRGLPRRPPPNAVHFHHLPVRLPASHVAAVLRSGTRLGPGSPAVVGSGIAVLLCLVESAIPDPPDHIHSLQLWRRLSAAISRPAPSAAWQEADPGTGPGVQSRLSGLFQIFR